MNLELAKKSEVNDGICFVVFRSKQLAKRYGRQIYLKDKLERFESTEQGQQICKELNAHNLTFISATETILEKDIIWHNIGTGNCYKYFMRTFTFVVVFLLSVTLLLPMNLIKVLTPIYEYATHKSSVVATFQHMIATYLSTVVTIIINNTVIP